jgi:hypothetical protein
VGKAGRPRLYDHDEIKRLYAEGKTPWQIHKIIGCDGKTPYIVLGLQRPRTPESLARTKAQKRLRTQRRQERRRLAREARITAALEAIREFSAWNGGPPHFRDWGTNDLPSANTIHTLFGGAGAAVRAAGFEFEPDKSGGRHPTVERKTQADVTPCQRAGCHRKGLYLYSDFLLNLSEKLCLEHYQERMNALSR